MGQIFSGRCRKTTSSAAHIVKLQLEQVPLLFIQAQRDVLLERLKADHDYPNASKAAGNLRASLSHAMKNTSSARVL